MKEFTIGLKWLTFILVISLCSSCSKTLTYWKQAGKSFSQGAEMESKNHFADRLNVEIDIPAEALPDINDLMDTPATEPAAEGTPMEMYEQADEQISAALEAPEPLVKVNKMGNALTLKALACWKTHQPEEARTNAEAALQAMNESGDNNPRDKPLARAVPALVAMDLAYDSTEAFVKRLKDLSGGASTAPRSENQAIVAEGTRLYRKFISDKDSQHSIAAARALLQEAAMMANQNEELRRFFLLCELTGLKNRFDFLAQLNNFASLSGIKADDQNLADWLEEERSSDRADRKAAKEQLKTMLGGDEQNSVYRFWDDIL